MIGSGRKGRIRDRHDRVSGHTLKFGLDLLSDVNVVRRGVGIRIEIEFDRAVGHPAILADARTLRVSRRHPTTNRIVRTTPDDDDAQKRSAAALRPTGSSALEFVFSAVTDVPTLVVGLPLARLLSVVYAATGWVDTSSIVAYIVMIESRGRTL